MVREAKIGTVLTNAEIAYWAAEAGFNRARARLVGGDLALDGWSAEETLLDSTGKELGWYAVSVTADPAIPEHLHIVATGEYGVGILRAQRVITGTIWIIPELDPGWPPYPVHTLYH